MIAVVVTKNPKVLARLFLLPWSFEGLTKLVQLVKIFLNVWPEEAAPAHGFHIFHCEVCAVKFLQNCLPPIFRNKNYGTVLDYQGTTFSVEEADMLDIPSQFSQLTVLFNHV